MGSMSKLMDQIDESEALAAENVENTEEVGATEAVEDAEGIDITAVQDTVEESPDTPATELDESFGAFEAMAEEAATSIAGTAEVAGVPDYTPGDVEITGASECATGAARVTVAPDYAAGSRNDTAVWDAKRVDPAIVTFHNRYASICEQYRSLRARLLSMNPDALHQVLVITSAVPEEGKSVTTLNLAIALAEGGEQRALMVDMDLRRSSMARMLGQPTTPGVAEVLRGEVSIEEAIRDTPYANLKLLAAGKVSNSEYGEVFASPALRDLLDSLRVQFNYCLLDTPPVTTVSDVSMLGPSCDGALLVIEMGRTPEPAVQVAVRSLQTNNVNVLGCVLGRFRDERSHYYDRYYYYYRQD